jgi:alpha-L-arabinofuranosidase
MSVSASEKKDEKSGKTRYLITVVNTDDSASKNVEASIANIAGSISAVEGTIINGSAMNSINTFDKPDVVVEKSHDVKIVDRQTVAFDMPAHSVVSVTVLA